MAACSGPCLSFEFASANFFKRSMSTFRLSRPRGVLIHINFQSIFNGSFKISVVKNPRLILCSKKTCHPIEVMFLSHLAVSMAKLGLSKRFKND